MTTVVIHEIQPVNVIVPAVESEEEEGIFDLTFDSTFE